MDTIIAYFDSDKRATMTVEKLRKSGIKGEISILKPNNKGVFYEIENQGQVKKEESFIYGINSGIGGSISFATTMMPRYEPMPISILNSTKKVPENKKKVLKNIYKAGNTIIIIDDIESNAELIESVLREKEAKLI